MIELLSLLLYALALILWLRDLLGSREGRRVEVASGLVVAGFLAHLLALTRFVSEFRELPLVGLAPSLSTLALFMGAALVLLVTLREASRLGIVLVPLILLLQVLALALGVRPTPGAFDFQGAWFAIHVFLAFVAFGGFALAFAASLLYLVQFHELKSKHLGRMFRFLPPLTTLDRLGRIGTRVGFISLSVSMAVSWAWTVQFTGSWRVGDPKVLWAIVSWIVLGTALLARRSRVQPERRAALVIAVGFGVVVALYLVLRIVMVEGSTFL